MDELTIEKNNNKIINLRFLIHLLLTIAVAGGVAWFSNEIILEKAWNRNYFLFAGVLYGVLMLCAYLQRKQLYVKNRSLVILLACFVISALLLLLSDYYVDLPIWLLGGIVTAALIDRNIGLLYMYFFVFHAIYLQGNVVNGLVFHFVVTTILCLFISKMKTFLSMFYMMALTACVVVTASIINNQFSISSEMMIDTLWVLCTYIGCILITMLLMLWFGDSVDKPAENEEESNIEQSYDYLTQMAEETAVKDAEIAAELAVSQEIAVEEALEKETITEEITEEVQLAEEVTASEPEPVLPIYDYASLCKLNAELMKELRVANKSSYAQAVYLGKLSGEAAASLGLDENLVKAAGMYKRIGKLREDNKESTLEIIQEHEFPAPLVQLIMQLWEAETTTKEAAVIKVTEKVSNYYITMQNSAKKNMPIEKIVDTVLTKQLFQGEYNQTGLSVEDFTVLRQTLVRLFSELKAQQEERNQGK